MFYIEKCLALMTEYIQRLFAGLLFWPFLLSAPHHPTPLV